MTNNKKKHSFFSRWFKNKQDSHWSQNNLELRRAADHPVIQCYTRPKAALIAEIIKGNKSARMLECGAGSGFFTKAFAEYFDVTALDLSAHMLSHNPHFKKVTGDAAALSFADSSFDIVALTNILHHMNQPGKAVSEASRVAKQYTVFIEPNRNNPLFFIYYFFRKSEWGAFKISPGYMKKLICSADLKIVYAGTMGLITPNLTPVCMLPFLAWLEKHLPIPLRYYILIIAEKKTDAD